MNRLQKKCLIGSASLHLLLGAVLFVGPAFLASSSKPTDDTPVLTFVPLVTSDKEVSGGGEKDVKSAPPAAQLPPEPTPLPQPAKQPEKQPDPEPVKEVKPPKPDETSLEPAKESKPKKPEISLKQVTRPTRDSKADARKAAEAEAKAQAQAAERARQSAIRAIGEAADRIGNGVSGGTDIKLQGPGGGGVPYANFLQAVKSVYERAWVVPDGVADDDATTTASVTIARDGTVISSRITRSSGNAAVDHSVRATLDRVTFAAPLPPNAKEEQRTVSINFNVRAKRAIG